MPPSIVALVGAPNTGKSTLFNRLIGRRKALIHAQPGMTRDLNEERCDWGGRPVTLQDTGGLLAPGDSALAGTIRRRVLEAARGADLLVLLVDGRAGVTPQDEEIARLIRKAGRPVVVAVNKIDVPAREAAAGEFHRLGFPDLVPISAEHGLGLDELIRAVSERLQPGEDEPAVEDAAEVRIAIAGRPNGGKSSLLNALLGQDRVLVSEVPGTTRDAIDCLLSLKDRIYRIVDTAGIRRPGRVTALPESLSVMAAGRSVRRADVVLIVMDATEAPTQQDLHVAGVAHGAKRPFIVLLNKWDLSGKTVGARRRGDPTDLPERIRQRLRFAPHAPLLTVSALTGFGVGKILPLVDDVHAQASRRLPTGRLNAWLERAVAAHRPPVVRGRSLKFFYAAQTGSNPPAFVFFTNRPEQPHFSYRRYLENSLRESFTLDLTPVSIEYRERPRRRRVLGGSRKNAGKRSV